MADAEAIWFVYDGACPICQTGACYYRPRPSAGRLHVVDGRTEKEHPVVKEIKEAGLDLDEGMVIKYRGRLYHGRKALHLMATLGEDMSFFNKVNNRLFRSAWRTDILYPYLKAARNLALKVKGIGKIRNLQ